MVLFAALVAMRLLSPDDTSTTLEGAPSIVRTKTSARFVRPLRDADHNGLVFDAPGARVRFKSDSHRIIFHLYYTAEHTRVDARNSLVVLRVNGAEHSTFKPDGARPAVIEKTVDFTGPRRARTFELVLPYADSVEWRGLSVEDKATVVAWPVEPRPRWVACGDSITQGFSATDTTKTYSWIVGEKKRWSVWNFGVGGRTAMAEDGAHIAETPADIYTVLLGFNDFYRQDLPTDYAARVISIARRIRDRNPRAEICLITPLWSSEPFPANPIHRLAAYRIALREAGEHESTLRLRLIDGLTLIPPGPEFFTDGVHPNDQGFTAMADNLLAVLPEIVSGP